MWWLLAGSYFSNQKLNPGPWQLNSQVLTTGLLGNSCVFFNGVKKKKLHIFNVGKLKWLENSHLCVSGFLPTFLSNSTAAENFLERFTSVPVRLIPPGRPRFHLGFTAEPGSGVWGGGWESGDFAKWGQDMTSWPFGGDAHRRLWTLLAPGPCQPWAPTALL